MEYTTIEERSRQEFFGCSTTNIRAVMDGAGTWLLASDVCTALQIPMSALKSVPDGLRGKCRGPSNRQVSAVTIAGALWLIMKANTRASLTPTERFPVRFLDEHFEELPKSQIGDSLLGALRGLSEAMGAAEKINKVRREQEKRLADAPMEPCDAPEYLTQKCVGVSDNHSAALPPVPPSTF